MDIVSVVIIISVIFNIVTAILYKKKINESKNNIKKLIRDIRKLEDD